MLKRKIFKAAKEKKKTHTLHVEEQDKNNR